MQKFSHPSRKALILGAILVQLHGHRREAISDFRIRAAHERKKDIDWRNEPVILDIEACEKSVRAGGPVRTANQEILDSLAYTQQTLGVTYEEWEAYVKVERLAEFPVSTQLEKPALTYNGLEHYEDLVRPGNPSLL